ncbi:sulfite exporter TauE/SafE family protein, partial [Marivivens sp.]|uniref:sulfite exporter TauE/SafE family protein n=1 Tax=Marivivens sp. TaxID=1978374 RepID=UPI00345BAC0D
MSLEPALIVELLLWGCFTGFLAGLLGIGGGMIMVPFITYILTQRGINDSLAVKMAIATSMATIIFTSLSSVRSHHKRGTVMWPLVGRLAPGIVLGSMVASLGAFTAVKGQYLALFFALFVGFSAFQMMRNVKPKPSRSLPGPGGQFGAGGLIGFLSGMVGAGGAFI